MVGVNLDLLCAPALGVVSLLAVGAVAAGNAPVSIGSGALLAVATIDVVGRSRRAPAKGGDAV